MRNLQTCLITAVIVLTIGICHSTAQVTAEDLSFFEQVEQIPDSIVEGDMAVYNLFKYQVLAHKEDSFDSLLIIDKVYKRHQKIWDELYAVLFDEHLFSTEQGMVDWNRQIFNRRKDSIKSRVNQLISCDFSKKLKSGLQGIERLTGRTPKNVRLSIILSPNEGIGFGGMENDAFILDLLDNNFDVVNLIEEGIPHELNHFIYEPTRKNDPHKDTPLRLTIDEGLACYYAYKFFDGRITKAQAVEGMNDADWQWYLNHEKEVYKKCEPYFYYLGKEDPLRQLDKELNAPKTLFYWLGFRIVEFYVKNHGNRSWLDIYELPVKEVLEKSEYQEYIEKISK